MSIVTPIAEAIEAGDPEKALQAALAAWRATPAVELAGLVDQLGSHARASIVPPRAAKQIQRWWIERIEAADPSELVPLLDLLKHRSAQGDESWAQVNKRVEGLAGAHPIVAPIAEALGRVRMPLSKTNALVRIVLLACAPDDPRLTALFTRWAIETPYRWGSFDGADVTRALTLAVYEALFARLAELGDARCVDALHACTQRPRAPTQVLRELQQQQLPKVITAIEARARILSTDDRHAILALQSTPAPLTDDARPEHESALWQQVSAKPGDDGPREILADWLLARGDLRGEFIQLQLAAARSPNDAKLAKRTSSLLRANWAGWLGDLALVLHRPGGTGDARPYGTVFERGAIVVARVGLQRTPPWAWEKIRGHPLLSCVRRVVEGYVKPEQFVRFLEDPALRPQELAVGDDDVFEYMRRARPAWETRTLALIHCDRFPYGHDGPTLGTTLERIAPTFPALEAFRFEDSTYEARQIAHAFASASVVLPSVRDVSFGAGFDEPMPPLEPIVAALPGLRAIAIDWPGPADQRERRKAALRGFHRAHPHLAITVTFKLYADRWLDDERFELPSVT